MGDQQIMRVGEDSHETHPLGTEKHEKQKERKSMFVCLDCCLVLRSAVYKRTEINSVQCF